MLSKLEILIVDDEETFISFLAPLLERNGYTVTTAYNGREALNLVKHRKPDLIVTDVIMPGLNGRELLRELRKLNIWTPVILLTQIGESYEKAIALNEGADDYLDKPFDPYELIARIQAVLRRSNQQIPSLASSWKLKSGSLLIDRSQRQAYLDGQPIQLTPKAFTLLEFLVIHPDEVLTKRRLLNAVWGWDFDGDTRTLSNRIVELRRQLDDDNNHPKYIETVSGQGYRFIQQVECVL